MAWGRRSPRLLLEILEDVTTPAPIFRWRRRSGSVMPARSHRQLVLPEAEGGAVRAAEQGRSCAAAASACHRRPGRTGRPAGRPASRSRPRPGSGYRPVPEPLDQARPQRAAAVARPRRPAARTSASVSQVASSRSLACSRAAPFSARVRTTVRHGSRRGRVASARHRPPIADSDWRSRSRALPPGRRAGGSTADVGETSSRGSVPAGLVAGDRCQQRCPGQNPQAKPPFPNFALQAALYIAWLRNT